MERSQEVRGCDRNRHLSKTEWECCVFGNPKRKMPPVCRRGHLGLTSCIRRSKGTEPTECSCLQKEALDCLTQWARYSNSGHLHTAVCKAGAEGQRDTPGEHCSSVWSEVGRVLTSKKKGGSSSSRIDALTARPARRAGRQTGIACLSLGPLPLGCC